MKRFQDQGFEVHAIGNNSMGRKDELVAMGIICHDVEFYRIPLSGKNLKAVKVLNELFEKEYFDLIHVHTPTAAFFTRYVASKHKQGRILYTAHGFHFFKGAPLKNWALFYPAEKYALKWTDGLIVMNTEDFQLAKKLGYKKNENVFKVHGVGVNMSEFNSKRVSGEQCIRDELKLGESELIISCIAELSSRKNQMFLLENWQAITEIVPNAHLLLIGNGVEKSKIKKFIKNQKLQNVYMLGFRHDVSEIISSSDIITLVSKHEGLPKCLMEAMACGKVIVTTNIRGSRDLVEHEKNGLVVELGDNNHLVQSFINLLNSEQLRIDYGDRGQMKIQDYSLKKVIGEMDQVYSRYLSMEGVKT